MKQKRESRIEIYLAIRDGIKPKDLIKRGIPPATVYAYFYRFKKKKIMDKYLELLRTTAVDKK